MGAPSYPVILSGGRNSSLAWYQKRETDLLSKPVATNHPADDSVPTGLTKRMGRWRLRGVVGGEQLGVHFRTVPMNWKFLSAGRRHV
jgi:hypothetical protein